MEQLNYSQAQTMVEISPEHLEQVSGGPLPVLLVFVAKVVLADVGLIAGGMSLAAALSD
jgi:hypothetical protein